LELYGEDDDDDDVFVVLLWIFLDGVELLIWFAV